MFDICCIGHITSDKVVTPASVMQMPGGTAWYFSHALARLDVDYLLVTAVAETEMDYVKQLENMGTRVKIQPTAHTVQFENIYGNDPDQRTQKVLQKAAPFTVQGLDEVDAKIFHLGPLLADDIPVSLIKTLASKSSISLDVQGYLRKVIDCKVYPTNWADKVEALAYISILKEDENELLLLTGQDSVTSGILFLADMGVKEIIVTNGSRGSVIYSDGKFYQVPAYFPATVVDATGCGDTYMAGYLYQRVKGTGIQKSGEFAAGMAGLKTRHAGPFSGTTNEVNEFLATNT